MPFAPIRLFWVSSAPFIKNTIVKQIAPLDFYLLFFGRLAFYCHAEGLASASVIANILGQRHENRRIIGDGFTFSQATHKDEAGLHASVVVSESKLRQRDHSQQLKVGQQPVAHALQ